MIHGDGEVLDVLIRWFEAGDFDVIPAATAFRAQTLLEGSRTIGAIVVPWDTSHPMGGELYRWALGHRADLRGQFVFIAEEVPPEFDSIVGGRCLAVPLAEPEEIVRVARAAVRRVRVSSGSVPVLVDTRPTLLLAEDEPVLIDVMTGFLDDAGYAVTQVESGNAAIAALERDDFKVIVSDWAMHDGSGAEIFRWIVTQKPHLIERIVFLSEGDLDDAGTVAPGRPMLRKGQDSQALLDVLSDIVRKQTES